MGKTSKQTQQQQSTTSSAIDDRYNTAAWDNYGGAQGIATDWKPVTIPTPLDFNTNQVGGQNAALGVAQAPLSPYYGAAGAALTSAAQYRPTQVSYNPMAAAQANGAGLGYSADQGTAAQMGRGEVRDASGGNIAASQMDGEGLERYLSMIDPSYTNNVVNQFLGDNDRARMMAQQPVAAAAANAGAFGGTRQAVLEAETNRGFADTAARTTSGLRLNEFNTGLNNYQTDLNRTQQAGTQNAQNALQAAMANQGMDFNVGNTNAGLRQGMTQANLGFSNQARQYGAGAQQNMSLANAQMQQQANMANAQYGLQAQGMNQQAGLQAQNLGLSAASGLQGLAGQEYAQGLNSASVIGGTGNQQYDLAAQQQLVDYQNATNQNNAPLTSLQMQQQALGLIPYGTTTNSSGSSVQTQRPSTFSTIMSGIGTGLQIGGAFAGQKAFASDARLKKNIKPMKFDATNLMRALKPVTYQWKHSGAKDLGFTAQNVEAVIPHAVKERGGVKHINLPGIVGLLAASVQELDKKLSAQGGK